jgi:hypothetical protein
MPLATLAWSSVLRRRWLCLPTVYQDRPDRGKEDVRSGLSGHLRPFATD